MAERRRSATEAREEGPRTMTRGKREWRRREGSGTEASFEGRNKSERKRESQGARGEKEGAKKTSERCFFSRVEFPYGTAPDASKPRRRRV